MEAKLLVVELHQQVFPPPLEQLEPLETPTRSLRFSGVCRSDYLLLESFALFPSNIAEYGDVSGSAVVVEEATFETHL